MRFRLDVAGDVQVDRELEAFATHATDVRPVLRDIGKDLNLESAKQFQTQGAYASGGWPPLSENYRKRKARMVAQRKMIHGRPATRMEILRLTDRMRRSLVNRTDPEHVERVTATTLEWGTRVPYMPFHQNPGPKGGKQRRVLELSERKRQQYMRAILTYLRTGHSGL